MTTDTRCLPNADRTPVLWVVVEKISGAIRNARKRRAQANALKSLLEMPAHRLHDLGISPEDVLEAMSRRKAPGAYLAGRRASRALERFQRKWTPLLRLENAPFQGFRAHVSIQSEREKL